MFALVLRIEYVDNNLEYTMVLFLSPFHMTGIFSNVISEIARRK